MPVPYPDPRIYEDKESVSPLDVAVVTDIPLYELERVEAPPTGGIFVYHKNVPYPQKGFITPETTITNDVVKRLLVNQLRFISNKVFWSVIFTSTNTKLKLLDTWIRGFVDTAMKILDRIRHAYLDVDERGPNAPDKGAYLMREPLYSAPSRAIIKMTRCFLSELGVDEYSRNKFALIIGSTIEYDFAYRIREEDLASETTKEELVARPVRETRRLLKILAERESRPHLIEKMNKIMLPLIVILMVPRVRQAFRKALNEIDFKDLQYDDADRYHTLSISSYKFRGRTDEDRYQEFLRFHNNNPPVRYSALNLKSK